MSSEVTTKWYSSTAVRTGGSSRRLSGGKGNPFSQAMDGPPVALVSAHWPLQFLHSQNRFYIFSTKH